MELSTERAWNALHDPLRLFIRKRVADQESAEDLLQETFLKFTRIVERYETRRS